jgi:hypothetical protein
VGQREQPSGELLTPASSPWCLHSLLHSRERKREGGVDGGWGWVWGAALVGLVPAAPFHLQPSGNSAGTTACAKSCCELLLMRAAHKQVYQTQSWGHQTWCCVPAYPSLHRWAL